MLEVHRGHHWAALGHSLGSAATLDTRKTFPLAHSKERSPS